MNPEIIEYEYRPPRHTGGGWTENDYVCYLTAPNGVKACARGNTKPLALSACRREMAKNQEYHALSDIEKLKRCVSPKLEHTHLYEAVELIAKILIKREQG